MRKINVAQIGTWKHTHGGHIIMSMRSMPHIYNVVGICEPDETLKNEALKKDAFKGLKWLELDEVLADDSLDAVIIETKELEQAKYALSFAEKGMHIHLEKPGGGNLEEFSKLVSLAKKNNSVLQLGYMYRYNPAIIQAMEIIKSGKIGDVSRLDAQMSVRYGRAMLDMLGEFPGGMMYFLGCHLIDLMYAIQGKPKNVIPLNCSSGTLGSTSLDSGLVAYEYDRGVSTLKTIACEVCGGDRRGIVIVGTNGTIELKNFEIPVVAPPITNANTVTMTAKYYTDYSLTPMIIGNILTFALSNVLVPDEAAFLTIATTVLNIYSILLIAIGTITIHDYDFKNFLGTTLLTIVGIAIVIFLMIMIILLAQQFWVFVASIFNELTL